MCLRSKDGSAAARLAVGRTLQKLPGELLAVELQQLFGTRCGRRGPLWAVQLQVSSLLPELPPSCCWLCLQIWANPAWVREDEGKLTVTRGGGSSGDHLGRQSSFLRPLGEGFFPLTWDGPGLRALWDRDVRERALGPLLLVARYFPLIHWVSVSPPVVCLGLIAELENITQVFCLWQKYKVKGQDLRASLSCVLNIVLSKSRKWIALLTWSEGLLGLKTSCGSSSGSQQT